MNVKFSQFLSLTRGYHPYNHQSHHHYHHQNLNRFSFLTWEFVVKRLKKEFPNVTRRLEYIKTFQNGIKVVASFLGRECSPIVAQRAFRGYRMLQLHSKLWSYSSTNPVTKRALFSFVILSLCQANNTLKEAIKDAELTAHIRDLEFIRELTAATVVCPRCKDRLVIDKKVVGVKYCHCPGAPHNVYSRQIENYPWVPFAETADLLIWRQPHPDYNGLYIYKVYGYYDDISAKDFLDAQLDIEYRKIWDDTALQLEVVESFPETKSAVIYWEMKWPKMFANRDYLFIRRHKVEKNGKNMVIMSKAVTHPDVPERKGIHRVTEYWSVMHIKAAKGISQPGVEFGLTYFDNPGVSLPQWLTTWAAITGIPDFLDKQRLAARIKRLGKGLSPKPSIAVSSQSHFSDKKKESSPPPPPSPPGHGQKEDGGSNNDETNEVSSTARPNDDKGNSKADDKSANVLTSGNNNDKTEDVTTNSPQPAPSSSSSVTATQQKEGKSELLSQFFKENILDIHS